MYKIFIDGGAGTTGLRLKERLSQRKDIELLAIDEDLRKDPEEKKRVAEKSDITFFCLPDDASRAGAEALKESNVKIIDASTAHRTNPDWVYGFAELSPQHKKNIADSKRVANPGCHASGFNVLVYPLIALGIAPRDYPFVCNSLTGYSGGGKKMIADYEAKDRDEALFSPRIYALGQTHKHLPEMQAVTGITRKPVFSPIVADFYSGMAVSVPLYTDLLRKKVSAKDVWEIFASYYEDAKLISVLPFGGNDEEGGFFASNKLAGADNMELLISGNDERIFLAARYDNLGKGASGAALQCMNLMLGCDETEGLVIK